MDMETVGGKASDVICDAAAKEYGDKADSLAQENELLEPIQETMEMVSIFGGAEKAIVFDILDHDGFLEEDGLFVYYIDDEESGIFDHIRLNALTFKVAGVPMFPDALHVTPSAHIKDGEVHVSFPLVRDQLIVEGTLENFQGSLQDIENAFRGNQFAVYWTTRPHLTIPLHRLLFGAIFRLQAVKISHEIVDVVSPVELDNEVEDEGLNEVQRLASAFPNHKGICQVASHYGISKKRNHELVSCRSLFQSVVGCNPYGPLFSLKLEDGFVAEMFFTRGVARAWRMQPKNSNEVTVMLASLNDFFVTLGGIPIATPSNQKFGQFVALPDGQGYAFASFGTFQLEAAFSVSSVADYVDQSTDRLGLLEGVTVRLLFVQVLLDRIRPHLNMLGIEPEQMMEEDGTVETSPVQNRVSNDNS